MLKQDQEIKQKSHEWTIKDLHLWFSDFVIFITTFLQALKSKSSNSSTDWADSNLSYHQLFLKKQLLAESCFHHQQSLIQTTIFKSSINQSIKLWTCWFFSSISFYRLCWAIMCNLISSAVWYYVCFDIVCSLISFVIWYCHLIFKSLAHFTIVSMLIISQCQLL